VGGISAVLVPPTRLSCRWCRMRVSLWWHSSWGARVLALLVSTVQSVAAARPVGGEHAISHAIHLWVFQDL